MAATIRPWTEPEVQFLNDHGEFLPLAILIRRFQAHASAEGWPPRTAKAIHLKLLKLGCPTSRIRADDLMSPGAVAAILGCSAGRVIHWIVVNTALLRPTWGGRRRYVSRESWRRLARQKPEVLGGFGADRLFELLEDRELADAVAAAHPYQRTDYRIRCVETGRIWANATAAARELFVSHSAIGLAIAEGRAVASLGLRFERLRGAAI